MTGKLSLSAKIALLVLANVVMLVGAFAIVAGHYYRIDFGTLLFAPATDRVVDVARQVSLELESSSTQEQTALMGRYAATYGADFYLFRNGGTQQAGRPVTLPPEVAAALTRSPRDSKGNRPPRRDGKGFPPPERRFDKGRPPDGDEPDPGPEEMLPPDALGRGRPPEERLPPPEARGRGGARRAWNPETAAIFQVSSGGLHWAGIRMPIPDPDGEGSLRGTLLIAAKSFYGTPLFFDFKPWLVAMVAVISIFAICWLPFIRSLTRSISQLTKATERISQGDFEVHLQDDRGDELGQLAGAINRMTGRLAGFVTGQKRFLGDIAHELCAPIARIQFGLGILEQRSSAEQQAPVAEVQDEVRQMSELVSELLSFSRAGMEVARRPLTEIDVAVAVRRAIARELGSQGVIRVDGDAPVFAHADEAMLTRAVSNVIRNAIRYAGDDGPISIGCERDGARVKITVRDSGPGLAPEDLDRVFAPFYRPEASRNRSSGGAGLGLAIVKNCVEACQGTVECRNRAEGGLEVEISLKACSV